MRLQDTQANCGSTALHNALAALGIVRSTDECAQLCKVSATNGTSPAKLRKAIELVTGTKPLDIRDTKADTALLRLAACLRDGHPVILCTDTGTHWTCAIGLLGGRFLVADSADSELVLSYTGAELAARWYDPAKTHYYGAVVV